MMTDHSLLLAEDDVRFVLDDARAQQTGHPAAESSYKPGQQVDALAGLLSLWVQYLIIK